MLNSLFRLYRRIIFFDTETTGFDADKDDQIIELAAIAADRDGSVREMDDFIHLHSLPQLPDKIMDLTGITDITLATQGIDEEDALRKFIRLMEPAEEGEDIFSVIDSDVLLVAHNAQFDLLFLAYALMRHRDAGKGWLTIFNDSDYLDTLTVYKDRRRYPNKLEDAIAEYGLAGKVENSHRAVDDCKALFEVTKRMAEEEDDLDKYVNLFGYNPKYGPTGRMLKKVTYKPQGFNSYRGPKLYE
ncbi:MAG: 3'-5' exonuclease [Clostridiales bacterium]|nr:3'-5' exonuclease [Clostridiales bacterium]